MRYNTSFRSTSLILGYIAILPAAIGSEPTNNIKRLFAEKCKPPESLRLEAVDRNGEGAHYQFEVYLQLSDVDSTPQPLMRAICEVDGAEAAAVVMSPDGVPYAFVNDNGLWVSAGKDDADLVHMAGIKFRMAETKSASEAPVLYFATKRERSECSLDFAHMCELLLAEFESCEFSKPNQSYEFQVKSITTARVRFNRERSPLSFPISELAAYGSGGERYSVSNVFLGRRIVRSILKWDQLLEKTFAGRIERVRPTNESFLEVMPVEEYRKLPGRFALPQARETGLRWLEAVRQASPDQFRAMEELLAALDAGLKQPDVEGQELDSLIRELHETLTRKVAIPSGVDHEGTKSFGVVPGWDITVARARTECLYGPAMQKSIIGTLIEAAFCPRVGPSARMKAADALGFIGLVEPEESIAGLRERAGQTEDAVLPTMLATVAVRHGVASEEDVKRLRDAMSSDALSDELRAYCLESLFLADGAAGLVEPCALLMGRIVGYREPLARCQLAAPCSAEGRELMIESLDHGDGVFPRYTALESLVGRLDRDDPQWARLMPIAKRYALDESADLGVRVKGSMLADEDGEDDEYRDRFIQSALTSSNPLLIEWTIGKHLATGRDADRYLSELADVFEGAGPQRLKILYVLSLAFAERPPLENDTAWDRIRELAREDQELNVRRLADVMERQVDQRR